MSIHIGKKIKEIVDKSPYTIVDFAKKINLSRDAAYKIFAKEYIDTVLLQKISKVLNHDFFEDYSAEFLGVKENKNQYGFATKDEVENLHKLINKLLHEFDSLKNEIKNQSQKKDKTKTYKPLKKKS